MDDQGLKRIARASVIVAVILALGFILASLVVTQGIIKIKGSQDFITVTGSAKKEITSDLIVWKGSFNVQSNQLSAASAMLKNSQEKVRNYLKKQGIAEKDIVFYSINTVTYYVLLPNGQSTSQVDSYRLSQEVEIKSNDVVKITDISRRATDLINEGVEFQSFPPQYFYTKIADLKIDMLAKATKDAKNRAEQIAANTNAKIGKLRSARMGVFQITARYSTEVSDMGINDTSSMEKEITAVVTCDFEMK